MNFVKPKIANGKQLDVYSTRDNRNKNPTVKIQPMEKNDQSFYFY